MPLVNTHTDIRTLWLHWVFMLISLDGSSLGELYCMYLGGELMQEGCLARNSAVKHLAEQAGAAILKDRYCDHFLYKKAFDLRMNLDHQATSLDKDRFMKWGSSLVSQLCDLLSPSTVKSSLLTASGNSDLDCILIIESNYAISQQARLYLQLGQYHKIPSLHSTHWWIEFQLVLSCAGHRTRHDSQGCQELQLSSGFRRASKNCWLWASHPHRHNVWQDGVPVWDPTSKGFRHSDGNLWVHITRDNRERYLPPSLLSSSKAATVSWEMLKIFEDIARLVQIWTHHYFDASLTGSHRGYFLLTSSRTSSMWYLAWVLTCQQHICPSSA